jgi:hypothetical protein
MLGGACVREKQMPTLAVQLKIGDYAKWRFTNTQVYRQADDANGVLIWTDVADVPKAREALAGQEIRSAMQEAGVVGPPKVHVVT